VQFALGTGVGLVEPRRHGSANRAAASALVPAQAEIPAVLEAKIQWRSPLKRGTRARLAIVRESRCPPEAEWHAGGFWLTGSKPLNNKL
jgi:hypothetical protein